VLVYGYGLGTKHWHLSFNFQKTINFSLKQKENASKRIKRRKLRYVARGFIFKLNLQI